MKTLNQQIMHDIHNEQRELSSSLSGKELFDNMNNLEFIDAEAKSLLWRGVGLEKTFFGEGMLHDEFTYTEMTEDEDMHEMYGMFYKAMITAGIVYSQTPDADPQKILTNELANGFSRIIGNPLDEYYMYDFLSGLIECETLAAWLLVSPIYGYSHTDISYT